LDRGGHGLANTPALLRQVLEGESWREFETQRSEIVYYDLFTDFVVTPPLKGLGSTVDLVRRIVADDMLALDLLDQVLQNPVGTNQHTEGKANGLTQLAGNGREKALRRLRKDAPELHAAVLAGQLSAHAAMVEAGFRLRTVSVPVGEPDRIANLLRKHMSAGDFAQLLLLLANEP
jgi:uncharacterized protein YbjQ (UPF0145 family)